MARALLSVAVAATAARPPLGVLEAPELAHVRPRAQLGDPVILEAGHDTTGYSISSGLNRKLKYRLKFWFVLDRFPAKLGPKTPLNGSGPKHGSDRAPLNGSGTLQEINYSAIS